MTSKYHRGGWSDVAVVAGDGMTLISPRWSSEQSLTVTALPSSVQGVLVLRVVGEVDFVTVRRLREEVCTYLSSDYRGLVLDFTGVSFLAACGIGLLAEIADQARTKGMTLRLVAHSPVVLRVLEVTSADRLVPRASTVADAVAQCAA